MARKPTRSRTKKSASKKAAPKKSAPEPRAVDAGTPEAVENIPPVAAGRRRSGFRSSWVWALLISIAIGAWLLSGDIIIGGRSGNGAPAIAEKNKSQAVKRNMRVRVRTFEALERRAELAVRGRTEADARVQVRAETAGVVEAVPIQKGARVNKGDVLCRIETGARDATVLHAEAQLAQTARDYEASKKLIKRRYVTPAKLAADRAGYDAARAGLATARLDLKRIAITAPFDGIVEEQPAETGDFLTIGGHCATVIATDPMLAVGEVSEREVNLLARGMAVSAKLATGETAPGKISFIASAAHSGTRTFRIEAVLDNPKGQLRDGVTAEIRVPLAATLAHRFSPALLTLNDAGDIGVRIVEGGDTVRFAPVKILSDSKDGVWVAGLPKRVTVITTGQDYVIAGEKITAVFDTAEKRP